MSLRLVALALPLATTAPAQAQGTTATTAARPVNIVEIEVKSGNRLLLNDRVRIATGQGAILNNSRTEANDASCPAGARGGSERTEVSFSLYNYTNTYRMSFGWIRPTSATGSDCPESGTQRVGVEQNVVLLPGQYTEVRGDADVTVRLRLIND